MQIVDHAGRFKNLAAEPDTQRALPASCGHEFLAEDAEELQVAAAQVESEVEPPHQFARQKESLRIEAGPEIVEADGEFRARGH
ncbi:MAG: hypothetical protein WAW54_16510 [Parvibaculum sedimenti]